MSFTTNSILNTPTFTITNSCDKTYYYIIKYCKKLINGITCQIIRDEAKVKNILRINNKKRMPG